MGNPVGYFITWHTYGTWLRGQSPGAVDDEHNAPGEAFIEPDTIGWRGSGRG